MTESAELPLIINTRHDDELVVFKPQEDPPQVAEGDFLITVPEDLDKLSVQLLVKLYNQATPGVNVNSLKPGTAVKFCYPALLKLAKKHQEIVKKETAVDQPKPEEETVKSEKEQKSGETPAQAPKTKGPKKREIPDKFRKGKTELAMREGSIRKQAYDTALNNPTELTPKLRGVVSWLVRINVLERES